MKTVVKTVARLRAVAVFVAACATVSTAIVGCPADVAEGEGEGEGEGAIAAEEARQRLLSDWEDTVLMPIHERFVTTSKTLADASVAYCADVGDQAAFAAVQEAWKAAHGAYKGIELFRFGPIVAYPERYGPVVDFWPAREAPIDELLAQDTPITAELLATKGAVTRGLPVVEVLLWPFGPAGDGQSLYENAETGARRCSFLTAASADINALATGLRDKWSPSSGGYVKQLTQPTAEGDFPTTKAAFSELVNRMGFVVENVRRDRLGRISADTIESAYSGRSIEAMRNTLATVFELFYGGDATSTTTVAEASATAPLGLIDHPRMAERPDLIEAFVVAQQKVLTTLAAIEEPFAVAVVEDRAGIAAADAALAELQRVLQADILNVLGLTLAFNDNDGD